MLVVDFRDLVSWHVLNIVVVSYDRISICTSLVGLFKPLREYSGILLIKEKEYSEKAAFFLGVLPETLESIALGKILLDANLAPVAKTVFVAPETLTADTLGRGVDVLGLLEPVARLAGVQIFVVISLKWKPTTNSLLRVSEFDTLFKY